MNWYSGSIAEAVALSKTKGAIFVVYIEGVDELSEKLRSFINNEKIKSILEGEHFVAIRLEVGSTGYTQFAQIYQLVPIPSLFFIGKNGTPLEIITGITGSIEEVEGKINKVLKLAGISKEKNVTDDAKASTSSADVEVKNISTPSTSKSVIQNDSSSEINSSSAKPDYVCEGDVCVKKTDIEENKNFNDKSETENAEKNKESKDNKVSGNSSHDENKEDSRAEYTKRIMEKRRKEREAEEARLEHEQEIKRRKEGQEMQNLKKWQKDQELHQLKEKIQREKLEEQAARQRILEQIAADKAERAQKMNLNQPTNNSKTSPNLASKNSEMKNENVSGFSRINFKMQTGESETHNFLPTDQFSVVRDFVKNSILPEKKIKEFSLATTFPRKEIKVEDDSKTLQELDLFPSAVLLIITPTQLKGPSAVVARSGGFLNIFNTLFWTVLSPVFYVFNYIKGFFKGQKPKENRKNSDAVNSDVKKRKNEFLANEASKKQRNIERFQNNEIIDDMPSTSGIKTKSVGKTLPYKRIANTNIHRLHDKKDSDDENNTWNGNSTQQQ